MIKTICRAIIVGAATAVGSIIASKTIETCSDPYKRCAFKQRLKRIKNAFTEEVESN